MCGACLLAVGLVALLLGPEVEPADGAVLPAREEGVRVAGQREHLVGRAVVAVEGALGRLGDALQVGEEQGAVSRAGHDLAVARLRHELGREDVGSAKKSLVE